MNTNIDGESIINILGIQSLPDERKLEIVEQATDLVQKRLMVRVMTALDDSKRLEFEAVMETGDQAKMNEFVMANVPEFSVWMQEEITRIKEELGNLAGKIQ